MYCEKCRLVFDGERCPSCKSKKIRNPYPDDICFLTEKEYIWSGMLADVLEQNNIPFERKNVLGAGITVRIGYSFEIVRFYVFYRHLEAAEDIVEELFSSSGIGDIGDNED